MDSRILQAATREVLEAYIEAIRRQDFDAAWFWRPYVVERLELLSEHVGDSTGIGGADSAE